MNWGPAKVAKRELNIERMIEVANPFSNKKSTESLVDILAVSKKNTKNTLVRLI